MPAFIGTVIALCGTALYYQYKARIDFAFIGRLIIATSITLSIIANDAVTFCPGPGHQEAFL